MEFENRYGLSATQKYDCLLFDLDDTLYPLSTGLARECGKNIKDYMVEKLGIPKDKIVELSNLLYKNYGTTMAGLRAIGYDFDYDEYHSFVHGRLPYDNIKPDPVLRSILLSLPLRKVIFTNADRVHAAKALKKLGLEDCFEGIICFETLNPTHTNAASENSEIFDIVGHFDLSEPVGSLPKTPIVCKPSESAIEKALEIANIDPNRTLFFEDSVRNVQAGKRVGLHTVLVGSPNKVKGADYALENIHNMKEALPVGFYAPCSHPQVSNHLTLLSESLPSSSDEQSSTESTSHGNRNKCPVPGTLYNTNTVESFTKLDKQSLLKSEANKIWEDIQSGKALEDCALLSRFLVISFADLKKWSFRYWFAFPALVLDPPASLVELKPASEYFTSEEAESVSAACNEWRDSSLTTDVPFFLVSISSDDSKATIRHLKDWEACQGDHQKLLFGFYDPCHLPSNPGWPLRNYLALIRSKWNLETVWFFCYRESRGFADMSLSLVGQASITLSSDSSVPNSVGWELNKGKRAPRSISLANSMDPTRLAVSACDLNLKLMRWRALPSLDLNVLSSVKCLLLGAGTLCCQVARTLMGWGIRNITFVDYGKVAMSNPVRQSLYTFEDCVGRGEFKAVAAVKSLKQIFPAVESSGVVMAIPMPGHPISSQEEESVLGDCKRLRDLIESHDAVFLLTDTRESRWLPSLLCANANKIAINAALGFDSYMVMRHGAGPTSLTDDMQNLDMNKAGRQRLGCYFCNDVVAPQDSMTDRTLDQQCTVTRPGLAPIAGALAVELLVGVLQHPLGIYAKGDNSSSSNGGNTDESPLGILPHQIRGSVSQFSQITLLGQASNSCTACSETVVSEYREKGNSFVLEAINHPTYLEDLTGLTELKKAANSFSLDWEDDEDDDEAVDM